MKRFESFGSFAVCTLLLLLLGWAAPAAAQEYSTWSDPQVAFPVPAGWYVSETTWVAERLIFATPLRVDPQRLLRGEAEVDALIQVKIDALDSTLAQIPLTELIGDLETRYRMASGGASYSVLQMGLTRLSGRDAAILVTEQQGFYDYSALVKSEEYLYEVRVAYRKNMESRYRDLPERVFTSLRVPELSQAWETTRRDTFLAALELPAGWHVRAVEGVVPAVFFTEEPLGEALQVGTGVSLVKVHNYAAAFGLASAEPAEAYRFWLGTLLAEAGRTAHRVLSAGEVRVGGVPSLFVELSYEDPQTGEHIQLINVSTARDGHFYNATFEAPVSRFYALRPMYIAAIRSLTWK